MGFFGVQFESTKKKYVFTFKTIIFIFTESLKNKIKFLNMNIKYIYIKQRIWSMLNLVNEKVFVSSIFTAMKTKRKNQTHASWLAERQFSVRKANIQLHS